MIIANLNRGCTVYEGDIFKIDGVSENLGSSDRKVVKALSDYLVRTSIDTVTGDIEGEVVLNVYKVRGDLIHFVIDSKGIKLDVDATKQFLIGHLANIESHQLKTMQLTIMVEEGVYTHKEMKSIEADLYTMKVYMVEYNSQEYLIRDIEGCIDSIAKRGYNDSIDYSLLFKLPLNFRETKIRKSYKLIDTLENNVNSDGYIELYLNKELIEKYTNYFVSIYKLFGIYVTEEELRQSEIRDDFGCIDIDNISYNQKRLAYTVGLFLVSTMPIGRIANYDYCYIDMDNIRFDNQMALIGNMLKIISTDVVLMIEGATKDDRVSRYIRYRLTKIGIEYIK